MKRKMRIRRHKLNNNFLHEIDVDRGSAQSVYYQVHGINRKPIIIPRYAAEAMVIDEGYWEFSKSKANNYNTRIILIRYFNIVI